MNIDHLISTIQSCHDDIGAYRRKGYKNKEDQLYRYHKDTAANNELYDLAMILGTSYKKLDQLGRFARKWEQRHNYEKCFPAKKYEMQILEFLSDKSPFTGGLNYLHWQINRRATKKKAA